MKVVCDHAAFCREPICGGKVPHEYDEKECGHCPKNKEAKCISMEGVMDRIDKFHAHLDVCSQCEHHPFELCPIGASLLREAATGRTI